MKKIDILWVDDEIELLKAHVLFLEQKNYQTTTCTNGIDAIDLVSKKNFDIVFLDEHMPGMSGLETLTEIKQLFPNLPVIMITKSEEESIMEEAIGSKIADYLIKPVNPHQILLSLKKNLDHSKLVSVKTTSTYQQEFRKISMDLALVNSYQGWIDVYKKLTHWELSLEQIDDSAMLGILEGQKAEANNLFFKFIKQNYANFITSNKEGPVFSHQLLREYVFPALKKGKGTLLVVIDNLRYDQFRVLEPLFSNFYKKEIEYSYFSILPSATQYARNALFSGLMPLEMEKKFPNYWKNDTDEGGKNLFENEFLSAQIKELKLNIKHQYFKITNLKNGKELADNYQATKQNDLTVVVYNFVDMLSHAKTEMDLIKELSGDDKAYRSLTASWFQNSPLFEIIQKAQKLEQQLIITTDHGTINCKRPSKVIGDRDTSSNLRYKTGRSLTYHAKDVYAVKEPKEVLLPASAMNSSYIFAKEDIFLAYQNNYNHYVKYYKNTYQHGGISLEELIIPCAIYSPK